MAGLLRLAAEHSVRAPDAQGEVQDGWHAPQPRVRGAHRAGAQRRVVNRTGKGSLTSVACIVAGTCSLDFSGDSA